jgi:hypothetical protein
MSNASVTIMQLPQNNGIWVAKCYKDGILVHTEETGGPQEAQAYADQWLSDQVDNNSD